jgi:hypothetical protein
MGNVQHSVPIIYDYLVQIVCQIVALSVELGPNELPEVYLQVCGVERSDFIGNTGTYGTSTHYWNPENKRASRKWKLEIMHKPRMLKSKASARKP